MNKNGYVASGKDAVSAFQLIAVKGAIRLEAVGLRHSSGRSARKAWALKLGLKATAKADAVIEAIDKELEKMKQNGVGFQKF